MNGPATRLLGGWSMTTSATPAVTSQRNGPSDTTTGLSGGDAHLRSTLVRRRGEDEDLRDDSEGSVTYGAHTKPSSIETWLEARMPGYRYGTVLVLLALTFVVMAAGPPDGYTRVITVTLQGLTLMASLLASRVSRRLFRTAAIVTLLAFIAAVTSVILGPDNDPNGVFFLLNVLLVATVPVVIARALWRRGTVDIHTVMGAICIYVLLGMMFAFVYAAIDAM